MKFRCRCLALACVFYLPAVDLWGAPVDLSPPKNVVGSADHNGNLRYVHRFGDIRFSDNFSIPLRFDFSSKRVVDEVKSEFHWDGWSCGAVESTAYVQADKILNVQLLCAKTMLLNPRDGEPGRYQTTDGEWTGIVEGNRTSIEREDGWALRFVDGRVESLRTDKQREIKWHRDDTGRVVAIQEEGTPAPQLTLTWREDGTPATLSIEQETYEFRFEQDLLSAIEWKLSSGRTTNFAIDQRENSLHLQTSKLTRFHYSWNPENGILLNDGINQYTLATRRLATGSSERQILSMTAPDGSVTTHEIGNRAGETRHRNAQGQEIVTTRVVSGEKSAGAVAKVELLQEGKAPLLLMANTFDEHGWVTQRVWLGKVIHYSGYNHGSIEPALQTTKDSLYPTDEIPVNATISVIHFAYTAAEQLETVTVDGGEILRFEYDEKDRVSRMRFKNRYDKTFVYHEDDSTTENLILAEAQTGPFWFLETASEGVGPNLVLSKTDDPDGRLLSQKFADGRLLTVEYDAAKRRTADVTLAPDGKSVIERLTYVHSLQDGTVLRIREDLLTGEKEYADISVYGIGKEGGGRRLPEEIATNRRTAQDQP